MENRICPNQPYGQHITVRCAGCNSIHSTKNIGQRNPNSKTVCLERGLFDILGCFCVCEDKNKHPLVHNCEIDDTLDYSYIGSEDVGLGDKIHPKNSKHIAGTQKGREVLQSWWKRFLQTKNLGEPTQEDLDELVLLKE